MPLHRLASLAALMIVATSVACAAVPGAAASFEHLTVDDGLPDSSVRAVLQDRQGFLWFGTQNGLVRFDGQIMAPFRPGDPHDGGTRELAVLSLLEDRDGDIWIGTFATGLWRLNRRDATFDQWNEDADGNLVLGGLMVTDLHQGRDGRILATLGEGGLAAVDPATGVADPAVATASGGPAAAPPDTALTAVLEDGAGRLWVGSEGLGLAWREAEGRTWRHLRHDPDDPGSLPSDVVTGLHQDAAGRVWVTTREGLALWNDRSSRFTVAVPYAGQPDAMANYLVTLDEDAGGRLWIGAAVGLYVFDPDTGVFTHYAHDPRRPDSPLRGPVLSLLCDRSGIVWGGTWKAGLNKHDPLARRFTSVGADPDDPGALDYESVLSVLEDSDGVLWVGTGDRSGGLSRGGLNARTRGGGFRRHEFPADDPVQPTAVLALCEDPAGALWIGTDRGLWRLPRGQARPERPVYVADAGSPLHDGNVSALSLGPGAELWIGTYGRGLFVLDRDTGRLRHYVHDPDDPGSLPQMHPIALFKDRRGRMWVGLDTRGLAVHDPLEDAFRSRFDPGSGLTSPTVMVEDAAGRMWVGALGGLFEVDADGAIVRTVTAGDGLPNTAVTAVLPDDAGRLWLSTGRGIVRYAPETGDIKTFDERDGLPTSEGCIAQWRGHSGTFYFGSRRGLISFEPGAVRDSEFVPPVVITELRVADVPVAPGDASPLRVPVELAGEVHLPHDQNDLTLAFASLHFARPERNLYRFRLAGAEDNWRRASGPARAFYTNLSPGRYRFEVMGSNADGLWNPQPAVLAVRILPPWYRTAGAYLVYALVTAALVLLVYRQVVQRERMRTALEVERAEARHLQQLDGMRSRFFANVSHEFRTPLTLLLGPLQRLERDPAAADPAMFAMMTRNARRLGQLIDQLLDLSRLEAGKLPVRWRHDDVAGFLRALVAPFAALADDRGVTFKAAVTDEPVMAWFDADTLDKVVGNLLTNALKFTPDGGAVTVTVTASPQVADRPVPRLPGSDEPECRLPARVVHIAVSNTGSYIPPEERARVFDRFHQLAGGSRTGGSGIGLALVRELVALYEGDIDVTSDPQAGTCFTLEMPVMLDAPPGAREVPAVADDDAADAARAELGASGAGQDAPEDQEEAAAATILVVEDNADLRDFVARELSDAYRVHTAADGDEGLAMALDLVPDVVVSDVMMPGRDGFELCAALKADLATSHVPVILLTARVGMESRLEGLGRGADDYVPKPFDIRELRLRIANLLTTLARQRERFAATVRTEDVDVMPVVSADDRFLRRCREIVDEHLEDEDFNVEIFAREVGLSRAQLHRKLKALLDTGPRDFIRTQRLIRAAHLLEGRYGNVTEVAFATGFKSLSHFARSFREQFGVSPSDYPGGKQG